MKRFIAKLSTWFARLAFWRKPTKTAQAEAPAPKTAKPADPEANETAAIPAAPVAKASWIARLKQALAWRCKDAPEPVENPDQTVVVKRPTQEQLEAAEVIEETPTVKLSLLARLKNKLRRQPKLEPLEDTLDESEASAEKSRRDSATADEDNAAETDADDAPKIGLLKRLLAKLCNKWVWIPAVSFLLLALIGSVLFLVLNTAHEKERLQTELQEAQKKLEKQTALVKKAAIVNVAPKQQTELAAANTTTNMGQATSESKPGVNPGDCLVTDKESVAKNLKDCIDSFNKSHPAIRNP